jgi:hypothetical protein
MFATSVPSQDGSHRPNCLNGKSIVFLVTMGHNYVVSNLKEEIQGKRAMGVLKNIDSHTLELWKVSAINESRCKVIWLSSLLFQLNDSNPITTKLADTLAKRVQSLGDSLSKFANKPDPMDTLFSIFPHQPSSKYVHIIVKVTATGE